MKEVKKEICECKNCGNEAEMVIACVLEDETSIKSTGSSNHLKDKGKNMRKKQIITCRHCGNEAEMWLAE